MKLRVKFAQGFDGGYWTADNLGKYSTSSGYVWLQANFVNISEANIIWGNSISQSTQSVYGGLGWVDSLPRTD